MIARSTVFVSNTVNTRLIALSHQSEDSDYRKELKYTYYDEATSMSCYTYSNDSEIIEEVDNSVILIFQQLLQSFFQSSSILSFKTLSER